MSIYYDIITVVGWCYEDDYGFIVQGDDERKLRDVLADARAIVTFNGSLFDIPFFLKEFPGARIPSCHVGLRFFAKRVGLSGGQKAIEKQLNIMTRPESVSDVKGEDAPLLWSRYCWGDASALEKLITYNRADVEGMKVIFDHVVQKMLNKGKIPAAVRDVHRFANGKRNLLSALPPLPDHAFPVAPPERMRPNVTLESLNIQKKHPPIRIIGIDLSGSEKRPSGWCMLDYNLATTARLSTDDDPERAFGIMRACERLLKKRGVNVYPA